jgi:uncharacterized protein
VLLGNVVADAGLVATSAVLWRSRDPRLSEPARRLCCKSCSCSFTTPITPTAVVWSKCDSMPTLILQVPEELRFLLPRAYRNGSVRFEAAPTDTVGHVIRAAGIPLTEVGALLVDDHPVPMTAAAIEGVVTIRPVARPQPTPTVPPRFLLDVHLGRLARRLRLLGLEAAYLPEATDAELVDRARAEQRVLLTQDRGLLRRRALLAGALVRGLNTAAQLDDVLDRFAPDLQPWVRCTRCGGLLKPTSLDEAAPKLEPGTRQTYTEFARCSSCGQIYWRGAHAGRLERVVEHAEEVVRRARR